MRERIYLDRLEELIKNYKFNLPLAIYLRQEFHKRRNMGSRDRRRTRDDVYNYFRIGTNFSDMSIAQRIAIGSYICNNINNPELDYILSTHSPFQVEQIPWSLDEKLKKVETTLPEFKVEYVFPFSKLLSSEINKNNFMLSFFRQPRLFIRMRKASISKVINEIESKKISFQTYEEFPLAISFPNTTPVHELKSFLDGDFEIQDLNSQRCADSIKLTAGEKWWDACAGSGGKCLAILDKEPGLKLTVSDVRDSSLQNLRLRIKKVSARVTNILNIDLSIESPEIPGEFDGIIADVPCSGSGTWARTPENLSSFSENSLAGKYIPLQRKIIQNLTSALKSKKHLIYITCSVFKCENEENVQYFEKNFGLKCLSTQYYEGAELGADTMFIAVLEKDNK